MITYLFLGLAALVLLAGLMARKRVHDQPKDDEPLDLDEIAREEERFWDETWDEPEGPFQP